MNCIEGLLLGLSTGATCLISCGPILIPYLLGERKNVRQSYFYVLRFLSGRLGAYLVIGFVVGLLGEAASFNQHTMWFGVVYCLLSLLMIGYGFHRFKQVCLGGVQKKVSSHLKDSFPSLIPFTTGFLTALNVCPPLLLAISGASTSGNVLGSVSMFGFFFIGTAVYFIPLPFVALFRKNQVFQIVGKYSAVLAGVIFFYKGAIIVINGL